MFYSLFTYCQLSHLYSLAVYIYLFITHLIFILFILNHTSCNILFNKNKCINIEFDFHLQKREEKEIITLFRFAIDFWSFQSTHSNKQHNHTHNGQLVSEIELNSIIIQFNFQYTFLFMSNAAHVYTPLAHQYITHNNIQEERIWDMGREGPILGEGRGMGRWEGERDSLTRCGSAVGRLNSLPIIQNLCTFLKLHNIMIMTCICICNWSC